jgi:hypothetical protein
MKVFTVFFVGILLSVLFYSSESFGAAAPNTPQTISGGGVTVKVTYLNPGTTDDPRFQVVLDTHSVNLDAYDLMSISVLRDDAGKTYASTGMENKGRGHHRETTVSFAKVSAEAKRLELVIKDVAAVKERVFRWNVD